MGGEGYWFISHCSKDIEVVDQIVNVLKNCGISYWKAPEMIPPGSNYAREIPEALKNCSVFLFIVSKASQSSIWVEKEVDIAINLRKKIIPVRIDNTPLDDMYRFYLNNVQTIDVNVQFNGQINQNEQKKLIARLMENTDKPDIQPVSVQPVSVQPVSVQPDSQPEKKQAVESRTYKIDTRSNALRVNKIPMQCEQCGTALENIDFGTYRCVKCNIDYYDDFQKIRNFLRDYGPAPAFVIARSTGVSRQTVDCYFNDDLSVHYSGMDYSKTRLTAQSKNSKGSWHTGYGKDRLGNRYR